MIINKIINFDNYLKMYSKYIKKIQFNNNQSYTIINNSFNNLVRKMMIKFLYFIIMNDCH